MRKDWDDYFMNFAILAAARSGCLSRQVGCVIIKDNRIIATGYNAAPVGIQECVDRGACIRKDCASGENLGYCFAVHAEQNAIAQCAKYGISCDGASMYITTQPCARCMKMIINSGINEIVFLEAYPDEMSRKIAEASGIDIRQYAKFTSPLMKE